MTSLTCWLVLDQVSANFPNVRAPEDRPGIALELAGYRPAAGSTEWLRYDDVRADRILQFGPDSGPATELPGVAGEPIHTHLPYDTRPEARRLVVDGATTGRAQARLVPAFLVTEEHDGAQVRFHVHSCCRIRQSGMLFARIWSGAAASIASAIRTAVSADPLLLRRFTDEFDQMMRFENDTEIELKLTFPEPVSTWGIACDLAAAVQARRIDGFIPDLGNESQRWTYDQDTFEVSRPDGKTGYIAFIGSGNGIYGVKFKFFDADALRRTETFDRNVTMEPADFVKYIEAAVPGAEIRQLPHLKRTRFDTNVESAATGHFFGLEMDEVHAGGEVLQQLEIEYHRSRSCYRPDGSTIDRELFRLAGQVESMLTEWGLAVERGYLSKLTFLRQVSS